MTDRAPAATDHFREMFLTFQMDSIEAETGRLLGQTVTAKEIMDVCKACFEEIGMDRGRIFIDPLVQPVAVDHTRALTAMESVQEIMRAHPGVHTVCGLSNVSFGLPRRRAVNRSFLPLMMSAGLDGVILDPLDSLLMQSLRAADMLLGRDPYCMNFLKTASAAGPKQ